MARHYTSAPPRDLRFCHRSPSKLPRLDRCRSSSGLPRVRRTNLVKHGSMELSLCPTLGHTAHRHAGWETHEHRSCRVPVQDYGNITVVSSRSRHPARGLPTCQQLSRITRLRTHGQFLRPVLRNTYHRLCRGLETVSRLEIVQPPPPGSGITESTHLGLDRSTTNTGHPQLVHSL